MKWTFVEREFRMMVESLFVGQIKFHHYFTQIDQKGPIKLILGHVWSKIYKNL